MFLVEVHQIKQSHKHFERIDQLCFDSKNLFNTCLYTIKQYELQHGTLKTKTGYICSLTELYHLHKNTSQFRNGTNTKVMKQIFIQVNQIYSNYFKALKSYYKDPSKFTALPKQPKYKKKTGRNIVTFPKEALSFKKKGFIKLASTDIKIRTKLTKQQVKEIRLIPQINYYNLEIVYEEQTKPTIVSNSFAGIDIGVNNLISLASNDLGIKPILINGRPIKSINQYYNKQVALYKSQLPKGVKTSKKIQLMGQKRANKIKDYFHKTTKILVNYLKEQNVSKVVIGHNVNWKQKVNLGKRTNQNFVYIPFNKLIFMLKYKCELEGISVIIREESYTSKCSFLDKETIEKQENYAGSRIKRGLFQSKRGKLINADINGALNILRKETNDQFFNWNLVEDYSTSILKIEVRR
jgi:putative transposase